MDINLGARTSTSSSFYGGSWENTNATTTNPLKVATSTSPALGDAKLINPGAASSTLIVDIENSDNIFLNVYAMSTTSAPTIYIDYSYTYDDIASTTGWYKETLSSSSGSRTTEATIIVHSLTMASTTDYYNLKAPTNRAKKMKINYTLAGASSYVYLDVNHK
jgi:hypothetical protein